MPKIQKKALKNNMDIYTEYAEYITNSESYNNFVDGINSIDDLPAEVVIEHLHDVYIARWILPFIYNNSNNGDYEVGYYHIGKVFDTDACKKMFEWINDCEYDNQLGVIGSKDYILKERQSFERHRKISSLITNTKIKGKKIIDECCVCKEETKVFTKCKHCLCLSCWSKLNVKDEEADEKRFCPLCRVCIDCV